MLAASANTNQNWNLQQAEKIDLNNSKISWNEAVKFSEERNKTLQNAAQNLKHEEENFIKQEKTFLESSNTFLEAFASANQQFIAQEEQHIRSLQEEITRLKPDQDKNEKIIREARDEVTSVENAINTDNEEQRRLGLKKKEVVDQIKPEELRKVKFKDPLDTSNDVFKWVLQCVYGDSIKNYEWKNFKKNAFKNDGGKDFLARMKGLVIQKLKKDDFVLGKSVFDRKPEILADLEPKGKTNESLRALFNYIESIVHIGEYHDRAEANNLLLDDKQKDLDKKLTEITKINNVIKMNEEKIRVSTHYIEELRKLKPMFANCSKLTRDRLELQSNYLETLKGNAQAGNLLNQSSNNKANDQHHDTPAGGSVAGGYTQGGQSPPKQASHESSKHGYTPQGGHGEEETISGQQHGERAQREKNESRAAPTDLKESEFASSNKGGCESCSIF